MTVKPMQLIIKVLNHSSFLMCGVSSRRITVLYGSRTIFACRQDCTS